jgi:hypothetical protein
MARTGRLEFFQQTELKIRRLKGVCAVAVGSHNGQSHTVSSWTQGPPAEAVATLK